MRPTLDTPARFSGDASAEAYPSPSPTAGDMVADEDVSASDLAPVADGGFWQGFGDAVAHQEFAC